MQQFCKWQAVGGSRVVSCQVFQTVKVELCKSLWNQTECFVTARVNQKVDSKSL